MKFRLPRIGLPLLAKDLTESASRPRTYYVRVFYASLFFLTAGLMFYNALAGTVGNPLGAQGKGRDLFVDLIYMQFAGLYAFLPAMTCSSIAGEKERNSLGLLFVTRLSPATIVLEKFLSRLIPMFSFFLIALPLLAFTYSLGGFSQTLLWGGLSLLFVAAIQLTAIGIACSAYCRTSVGAFMMTYVVATVLMLFLPVTEIFNLHLLRSYVPNAFASLYNNQDISSFNIRDHYSVLQYCFTAPISFEILVERVTISRCISFSLPPVFMAVGMLVLARFVLVRRAFVPPSNFLMRFFVHLDGFFTSINQNRITRGIEIVRERVTLPEDEPVAWRENTKKSLGTTRYLMRVLLALEMPLVITCVLTVGLASNYMITTVFSYLYMGIWVTVSMMLCVRAANIIDAERSHETLDDLLSTPITAREIVTQKFRAVKRLMIVLSVPLLTIITFQRFTNESLSFEETGIFLILSLLTVVIYLPLVAWLSFWIGLRAKKRGRATFTSLGILISIAVVPILVGTPVRWMEMLTLQTSGMYEFIELLSPASAIYSIEIWNKANNVSPYMFGIVIGFLLYGLVIFIVRRNCFAHADLYLGRGDGADAYSKPIPTSQPISEVPQTTSSPIKTS